MKLSLLTTSLPSIITTILLTGCVEEPLTANDPQPSATPTTILATVKSVSVDMSLPLPRGLKGNPSKAAVFFMQNCATCHGTSGDGEGPRAYFINPPPCNFLLDSSRQRLNLPTLFDAIYWGRTGSEMPAWHTVLSDQEIADLAEFVFQTFISPEDGMERGTRSQ
jgi:mono/diheme cytochrome c family protein